MKCPGLHCPGCGDGGGGALAVLGLVLVVIAAVVARPVARAAGTVGHVVLEALEITGIVLVSAAGLAILGGMAYGAHRLYAWHAVNRQAISRHAPALPARSRALSARRRRAIEAASFPPIGGKLARRQPCLLQLHPERIKEEK